MALALLAAMPAWTEARAETGAALPRVLSDADRLRYVRIFALQEAGALAAAEAQIAALDDPLLLGHVLAQKYLHPTAYRSRYRELEAWLERYGDHPDAPRIRKLALKRKPAGAKPPPRAKTGPLGPLGFDEVEPAIRLPARPLPDALRARLAELHREMRARTRRGWPTGATHILDSEEYGGLATAAQHDSYAARIGWSYYRHDKMQEALSRAHMAAERSRALVPDADWTAGLAAWQLGDFETAHHHFEALGRSESASPWLRAAGGYWAARTALRTARPEAASTNLAEAAAHPRTFYGLLALSALGRDAPLDWRHAASPPVGYRLSEAAPGARRAAALAEVGETKRAEREVRLLYGRAPREEIEPLSALAAALGFPAIQMGIARALDRAGGTPPDSAVYPLPRWKPPGGFTVDRALIFGLIRQESGFRAGARNPSGAGGVMQLMPATARWVAGKLGMNGDMAPHRMDPARNITLGQAYIRHLLEQESVGDNLFFLLAAYNAGPGNLAAWRRGIRFGDDPLLFIESLGSRETRDFIERVLANLWIYRMRLGQDTPSRDAVASGGWPHYIPQDEPHDRDRRETTLSRR